MIMSYLIVALIAFIFGLIAHEKLFPESKTVNEIFNNFKKSNISDSQLIERQPNGHFKTLNQPTNNKKKKFLGIFKRRQE